MKLCGLIGSNAEFSYNRQLLEFMKNHFADQVEIELAEIKDIPLFNQDNDLTKSREIQDLNQKILNADGVIIATPEHNHTIMPALKSVLEWLSFKINPLTNKPVMIVGASYDDQGSSRAQLHLRQILDSPGLNALVLPGNEFLLGKVKEAFDEKGNLKDEKAVAFLESILQKFLKFVKMVATLETPTLPILKPEDLNATGKIASTVEGIEMNADDWVEQATQKVKAVEGQTYVKLNRGLLTVEQIDCLLNSMPMEITFVDSNNQFLYYNNALANEEMLAARRPEQVGSPLAKFHPERTHKNVEHVIQLLRSGQLDVLRVHTPKVKDPDKYPVHNYQAMRDQNGHYLGINEYSLDFKPVVEWYLKQTGQKLTADDRVDAVSGASRKAKKVDAVSGASKKD